MKYVKMLGLAAVAAMALTAFLGASSASATVLCKTATNPCGSGWIYATGSTLSASATATSVLKSTGENPLVEDECKKSTVSGEVTSQGAGENVVGHVSTLTFTECTNTTTVIEQTGTLELEGTTVKGKGFQVTVNAGVSCVYSAGTGTKLGTFNGGNPATMTVKAVVNKSSGSFLCPADSVWEGTYTVTTPNSTLHSEPS